MKKVVPMVVAVMLLVCAGMALAFQNEPKGFRKLFWGNTPTSTMEFVDQLNPFMKLYEDPTESNSIGSVSFYRIFYSFYVDELENLKFAGVTLFYNTEQNFDALEVLCRQKFGQPTDKEYNAFLWQGAITTIHLQWDTIKERGWLCIDSTGLWDRYIKRKEKKEVEDAEEDW